MGFFNKLLGYRWSLYVVRNEKELIYAMHEHSVIRMLGYVMTNFKNGGLPVKPWSLHLNFNKTNQSIKLGMEHFTQDGYESPLLLKQIESIDSGWKVKGSEPVFEEVSTKKRLEIGGGRINVHEMLKNQGKPREITFFTVMRQVFDK